ncbi:MAG: SAM-dependent methyltransferase [Myxococcaceae bacterium]|nr:SAM-dependent methyltransferase [Myxococcaceae bacterium]
MEIARATEIFDRLYADVPAYEIAQSEKKRMGMQDLSTTYGEILPQAFHEVLSAVSPREGEVFFDLGSGTGKATLLAALAFPFSRSVGIELLPGLGDAARQVLGRFDAEVRPGLSPEYQQRKIEYLDGDFLRYDLSEADVVFAHGTCYPHEVIGQLGVKLAELRPGSRVVFVGHTFDTPELKFLRMMLMKTDWGSALAALYERA